MTGFFYPPTLLESAVREAVSIHRRFADPDSREAKLWLAAFLERLAATSDAGVVDLAWELRLSQLKLLSFYLPHLESTPDTFRKALICLKTRPEEGVCKQLWGLLGRYCDQLSVIVVLEELRADPAWQELTPPDLPELPTPLGDGERIAVGLSRDYVDGRGDWLDCCRTWQSLSPATSTLTWEQLVLGRHCLRALLTTTVAVFERQPSGQVIGWVEDLLASHEPFCSFARNYLGNIAIRDWSDDIVDLIVGRLGDPRLKPDNWHGFSKEVIKAVVLRINTSKLDEFFLKAAGDRERFDFWKLFVADMGPRSEGRVRAGQGFFEFPGFGVIEFMEIGNAAYVYRTADFEQMLWRQNISNSLLKDRDACINRIHHRGDWQRRWSPVVRRLLADGKRGRLR